MSEAVIEARNYGENIYHFQNKEKFTVLKKFIKNKLSVIEFAQIGYLFLVGKDKKITKVEETHCK